MRISSYEHWCITNLGDLFNNRSTEKNKKLLSIAEEVFKEDYLEYLAENRNSLIQEKVPKEKWFMQFAEDWLDDDMYGTLETIGEGVAKKEKVEAYTIWVDFDDVSCIYTLDILIVTPESKEDLMELINVYLQQQNIALPEVVLDKIERELL